MILEIKKECILRRAKNMEYETSCTTDRDSQILVPKLSLDSSDHCQFIDILYYCTICKFKIGY